MKIEVGGKYYFRQDIIENGHGVRVGAVAVYPILETGYGGVFMCKYIASLLVYSCSGEYLGMEASNGNWDLVVAPTPAAGLVPWTITEVPHWELFRKRGYDTWWTISSLTRSMGGGDLVQLSNSDAVELSHLLRDYEHSSDRGVTWHPCGKKEGT